MFEFLDFQICVQREISASRCPEKTIFKNADEHGSASGNVGAVCLRDKRFWRSKRYVKRMLKAFWGKAKKTKATYLG